jgi:hypothetical protein
VHGANYAWHSFASDFGGLERWGVGGVRAHESEIDAGFAALAAAGASVVRYWVFPDMRGDGVRKDAQGWPIGVTDAALADVDALLRLAQKHDLYLMLALTSFDAFKADRTLAGGVSVRSIGHLVREGTADGAMLRLIQNVFAPVVERASTSRYAHRVFAWDLINEPEWAVADLGQPNMCRSSGDDRMECVSYRQMHWFLTQLGGAVRRVTDPLPPQKRPLVTIGAVRPSTHKNWEAVAQDLYQFHYYKPDYEDGPMALPRSDKPSIVGEFPSWGLPRAAGGPALDALGVMNEAERRGFHGALGWMYRTYGNPAYDRENDWPSLERGLRALATRRGCQARY